MQKSLAELTYTFWQSDVWLLPVPHWLVPVGQLQRSAQGQQRWCKRTDLIFLGCGREVGRVVCSSVWRERRVNARVRQLARRLARKERGSHWATTTSRDSTAATRAVGNIVYLIIIKGGSIAAEEILGSDAQYVGGACSVQNVLWTT